MLWRRNASRRAERGEDAAAAHDGGAPATDGRSRLGENLRLLRAEVVGFLLLLAAGIAVVAVRPTLLHDKHLSEVLLRGVVAALIALLGWFGVRRIVHLTAREFARRTDPRAASSLVFIIKLGAAIGVIVAELYVLGVEPGALVVSGAVAAVILALASQQLLGNIFAGSVLLASGIVVIGQTVRLQGGAIAGQTEGVIASIGLFHVRLTRSDGASMLIPNSVFQQLMIVPVTNSATVSIRARVSPEMSLGELSEALVASLNTLLTEPPSITLDGVSEGNVDVRIDATPLVIGERETLAAELRRIAADVCETRE